jgi:hypothetical protein
VIIGVNRAVEHDGRQLHVQIEDLGVEAGAFEARVYDRGTVLWRRRVPYEELLARSLPKHEFEDELRVLMEKTLLTVEAAILKGKLG